MDIGRFYYKIGISAQEHDDFVRNHEQVNLLQSSNWAKIKSEWRNERIGFYEKGFQVASLSLLIKKLSLGMSMIYIPRGPVMNYQRSELVTYVIKVLKDYGKRQKALFIKFDPTILLKQYAIGQDGDDIPQARVAISNLVNAGAIWTGLTVDIADSIQPRYQANRYTQAFIEESFPKHTKRLMKDAVSRGVIVKRATINDLEEFNQLVSLTEKRKQISLRNGAYFKKIMETYGGDAYLHLATVNIPQKLEEYQNQLQLVESEIEQTQAHQKKRLCKLADQEKSLRNYIAEFQQYTKQYPEEVAIAGIISISYGNVMEMLYAGMNDDFKKFYPQYLLYPKVFSDAYNDEIIWSNMGGVEGSLDDGLTKFKSNFNPVIEEFIGEFNIPVSPFYRLAEWLYTLRKQHKNKH